MNTLNNLSHFTQGYALATILFPVEYYLLKPMAQRIYNDILYYINPILVKFGKTAPVQLP
jgi:hypothetical protein